MTAVSTTVAIFLMANATFELDGPTSRPGSDSGPFGGTLPFNVTSAVPAGIGTSSNFSVKSKKIPFKIPEHLEPLSRESMNYIIAAYILLFCVGAPGNLFVFVSVGRALRKRQLMRSRIKILIWNLSIADLFVTFVVIPVEVLWRITVQWYGGNVLCKVTQFVRAFGLYLSSMIIACISFDRFFAVVYPLKVIGSMKRVRNMLYVAWSFSILFASPQLLVFSEHRDKFNPSFLMCSNDNYFSALRNQIMYSLLSLIIMYFAPLIVILVTYVSIIVSIPRKTMTHQANCRLQNEQLPSGNASNLASARRKTLWLSMIIVTCFVLCWTPFVAITLWFMIDSETAEKVVSPLIHEALFVTAVSNSCVNPILYGNYMKKSWTFLRNFLCLSRPPSPSMSRDVSRFRHRSQNTQSQIVNRIPGTNLPLGESPSPPSRENPHARPSEMTIVLKEFPS